MNSLISYSFEQQLRRPSMVPIQRCLETINPARTAALSYNPTAFHTVDVVVVADGQDDRVIDQDRVELSHGAYDIVTARDYPTVAGLRLPPRFNSTSQIATFRGQVLRNGRG